MFKFTTAQLPVGASEDPTEPTDDAQRVLLKGEWGAATQAEPKLRHVHAGGCELTFRATLVKLAGMKLMGIGTATALVAAAGISPDATRSCALAASINFIAGYFYYLIWQIRRQGWSGGPFEAARLPLRALGDREETDPSVYQRLFVQELAVDGLRATDWTITLVLMAIETDALIDSLAPTREPHLPALLSALIQPCMVQIGLVMRFYMNNLRYKPHAATPEAKESARMRLIRHTVIGTVLFVAACVMFGFTTDSVVHHIGPINNDTYPDEIDRAEATALLALTYAQIGYPLVAFIDFLWMHVAGTGMGAYEFNEYSPWLSTVKDVLYASLDVSTKAGLCLVAFLRATGY